MNSAKDLTREAPRSPRVRLGGYVILARTIDKCRALAAGKIGEYHFNCPLDQMLFSFKGVDAEEFRAEIERGASDEEMIDWMDHHGSFKTPDEISRWSDGIETHRPYEQPDRRDWFYEQCKALGLDASKITLFDWLEADDMASYAGK